MRTFACFGVVIIHVFSDYFLIYGKIPTKIWLFSAVMECFTRFSVPLFIMITGALLLKNEQSVKKSLRRFIHYLLVLILWSAIYIIIGKNILRGQHINFRQSINLFISDNVWYHLWYLYFLLGIYLILPLVSKLVKNLSEKLMNYFFILLCVAAAIPVIVAIFDIFHKSITIGISIPMTELSIGCIFLGYYIDKKISCNKKALLICLPIFLTSICATIVLTYLASKTYKTASQVFFNNKFINILAAAITFFILMKYWANHIKSHNVLSKTFRLTGALSLDIYLVHPLVIMFYNLFINKYLPLKTELLPLLFTIKLIVVFSISFFVALILCFIKIFIRQTFIRQVYSKNIPVFFDFTQRLNS